MSLLKVLVYWASCKTDSDPVKQATSHWTNDYNCNRWWAYFPLDIHTTNESCTSIKKDINIVPNNWNSHSTSSKDSLYWNVSQYTPHLIPLWLSNAVCTPILNTLVLEKIWYQTTHKGNPCSTYWSLCPAIYHVYSRLSREVPANEKIFWEKNPFFDVFTSVGTQFGETPTKMLYIYIRKCGKWWILGTYVISGKQ